MRFTDHQQVNRHWVRYFAGRCPGELPPGIHSKSGILGSGGQFAVLLKPESTCRRLVLPVAD